MKISVRNMVCHHCVRALVEILSDMNLHIINVGLGAAEIQEDNLSEEQLAELDTRLAEAGFERISSREMEIVERVKREILKHVRSSDHCNLNLSACIEKAVNEDYKTVSKLFSKMEGRTIERYYILQRIERVKELLSYGEMDLTEIAYVTDFSSVAHLSRQFKQITGMTPTGYIALGEGTRKELGKV